MEGGLPLYPEAQQSRNILIFFPPEKDNRNHFRNIEILILKEPGQCLRPK
jgi:hypothetical protein